MLDTNLFCKVITLVVCNVSANECNRHWSRGEIRVTRVKACNYTGERHAFMDEVGMGTFIRSGEYLAIPWPRRVTRVQQKGWHQPRISFLLFTAFKRAVWKMQTDFVRGSAVLPWGNKVQWYLETFKMREGSHKNSFIWFNCYLLASLSTAFHAHPCWKSPPPPQLSLLMASLDVSQERSWLTRRPLCNLSAGQDWSTCNPGQLRRAERRIHWAGCRQPVKTCESLPNRKCLSGGRGLREWRLTSQECKKKMHFMLGKQTEMAWGWDRPESRKGWRGFQKSHILCITSGHPVESRVKTIEDH